MRLPGEPPVHLSYCTNIHPAESWSELRRVLEVAVPGVRDRVPHEGPFGVGLRVSARAASELASAARLRELREILDRHGLYVFTLNGFPYGAFHGAPVKERVYLPDWRAPERLSYTNELATLLAELLPEGVDGSISTVPGALRSAVTQPDQIEAIADALVAHAAHLYRIRGERGRLVELAIEPEPGCLFETTQEAVAFVSEVLPAGGRIARFAGEIGLGLEDAEEVLRRHVGLCLDACHAAVQSEDPEASVDAAARAGVRIGKIQVSAGLRLRLEGEPALDAPRLESLMAFADDVYLHQVVERSARGVRRWLDLGEAIRAAGGDPELPRTWHVHFHVPVFADRIEPFESTRDATHRLLELQALRGITSHLEVETYTWGVLPAEHRVEPVEAAIARELQWTSSVLDAARGDDPP